MDSKDFFSLVPDHILDSVETCLKASPFESRATGRFKALNSIENRVYEVELESGTSVITKFYRPGRWTDAQINEEHRFLEHLVAQEIPAVPALRLGPRRQTLHTSSLGLRFAIFEKFMGRSLDELRPDELERVGHFLGRIHRAGQGFAAKTRLTLNPKVWGHESLKVLAQHKHFESNLGQRYQQMVSKLVSDIEPWFVGVQFTPVHGDCHLGNLLWAQGQPTFVDFDDFCLAPRVQDFWMLIGGRDDEAVLKLRALIKPYEVFCPFPYSELKLIEALRILRIVHYSAWIARRWDDPSFSKMFPEFGSERWWQDEVEALQKAQEELNTGFWGQIEPGAF